MTKEKFAQLLSGKAYYYEQLATIGADAKHRGLIVVYNLFDGITIGGLMNKYVVNDYGDPCEDSGCMLYKDGVLHSWKSILDDRPTLEEAREWFRNLENAHLITLKWNDKRDYWHMETDLPHAKFTMKDFNDLPCGEGIVIDAKDLQ
jgi:hypothetical protein